MSHIDDLIAQHCPNGVEFKALGDCVERNIGGGTPARSRSEYWAGEIPWASVGDITATTLGINTTRQTITRTGLENSSSNIVPRDWVVVAVKIAPGAMRVVERDLAINQDIRGLKLTEDLDPYFLTYFFQTINVIGHGTIVKGITSQTLLRIKVPVPPIEVQRAIVEVLDTFSRLEAELEAELEARKQQYEHYRIELLAETFGGEVQPLGEIFEMRAGTHVKASEISEIRSETHPYRCFGGNGVRGFVSSFNYNEHVVFVGRQGALCGNVHRAQGKIYATEHAVVVTPKMDVDMSWAFHKLTEMDLNQYKTRSAQPGLAVGRIKELTISLPPIDEQRRIGSMLDKFDDLVNDLSVGLPAELAARRQQYEYYREKLLMFKELEAAA